MAFFWSRFQIPNLLSPKESGHQSLLLGRSPIALVNVRSFIFWKSKTPVQYGYGDCGKQPLPKPVEPCKGCPSQCQEYLQPKKRGILGFRKKPKTTKPKPSNCPVEEKEEEKPETWWETFFGPDPKKSWPDPCTCRLMHRQKKKCRQQNPKLCDSRYQETAGDVFLYTEMMRPRGHPCFEPQPKPPPSFKLPKDIMIKKMRMDDSDPFECETIRSVRNGAICTTILPPRIPYEELRPPERRRQPFSCQRGIRSEDVLQPINKDTHIFNFPSSFSPLKSCPKVEPAKKETIRDIVDVQTGQKRSRIEQLKFLVRQKTSLQCASGNP